VSAYGRARRREFRVRSCVHIGSRIARKSHPFRVLPPCTMEERTDAYTPIQHACRSRWVSVRNIQLNRRGTECRG